MYAKYLKDMIVDAQRKAEVEEKAYWDAKPEHSASHLAMKYYHQGVEEGLKHALPLADMLDKQNKGGNEE